MWHTRVSPSGARGSVIQEPNLDPDVLMVMGSLMPVSLPHAESKEARRENLKQTSVWVLRLIQNPLQGIHFHLLPIQKDFAWRTREFKSSLRLCLWLSLCMVYCAKGAYYSSMFTQANACFTVSVWTCEKIRGRGNRKGRASVYSAPVCCLVSCRSVNWCWLRCKCEFDKSITGLCGSRDGDECIPSNGQRQKRGTQFSDNTYQHHSISIYLGMGHFLSQCFDKTNVN